MTHTQRRLAVEEECPEQVARVHRGHAYYWRDPQGHDKPDQDRSGWVTVVDYRGDKLGCIDARGRSIEVFREDLCEREFPWRN